MPSELPEMSSAPMVCSAQIQATERAGGLGPALQGVVVTAAPRACSEDKIGSTPTTRSLDDVLANVPSGSIVEPSARGGDSDAESAEALRCQGRLLRVLGVVAALCAAVVGIFLLTSDAWSLSVLEAATASKAAAEPAGFLRPKAEATSAEAAERPVHAGAAGTVEQLFVAAANAAPMARKAARPTLPSPMLAGYTGGADTEKIVKAVRAGVNTIYWSFLNLRNNGLIVGLDINQVLEVHRELTAENISVAHMVSIGGWNGRHDFSIGCTPGPCDGARYAASFETLDAQIKAVGEGWPGFTGIDWDIEGHDNWNSTQNEFTLDELTIMLDMSRALSPNFVISMVPAQSYFNCRESGFDLSLRHAALSNPGFKYAGLNAYAALYAKAPEVFDVVIVQLYEGYSDAGFDLYWGGSEENIGADGWPRAGSTSDMTRVVRETIECITNGSWKVDFNGFWGLPNRTVIQVPLGQAVIGLANGWAPQSNFKFAYFDPHAAARAIRTTRSGGAAYWTIAVQDPANSFTRALRRIL